MATWLQLTALIASAIVIQQWYLFHRLRSKLSHIPTIGSDWFILSYIDAWKFLFKGQEMIAVGYEKYGKQPFKVPTLLTRSRWLVLASTLEMVEDMRMAPEEVISFRGPAVDLLQKDYLLPLDKGTPAFHVPVVRSPLTKGFPPRFGDISEEIQLSCEELLGSEREWRGVPINPALVKIVCRTSSRFFVGLPACRDPEYLQILEQWATKVLTSATILQLFPDFLKGIIAPMMLPVHQARMTAERIHGPLIQDRLAKMKQFGKEWEDKPNDLITWLIESAPPELRTTRDISTKIMLVIFAAIHTTSLTATNALMDLAARQEYVVPLRQEIEENIAIHGWTREAMAGMHKLDSFMKESARLGGFSAFAMRRQAAQDFTFSNGLTIPRGVTVAVASGPMQRDCEHYKEGETFRGFRFSDEREKENGTLDPLRHQMVALDPSYMLFGYGRNACPGRFFAVNEVKAIFAHIILTYDFKLPGGSTVVPEGMWIGASRVPSASAEILFRKRKCD